jgi:hypothetical protein
MTTHQKKKNDRAITAFSQNEPISSGFKGFEYFSTGPLTV